MSGRIALMVRGLPSIPIDEAVERFGKYYPEPKSGIFHTSPSFTGISKGNSISFVNAKTGDYSGGQGLNKQVISDLRKLQEDFNQYSLANPGIYTNSPTTGSRAKLYRRVGFQQSPDSLFQAIDTRSIADADVQYVKAIDAAIFPETKNILQKNTLPAFFFSNGNVLAASRLNANTLQSLFRGIDRNSIISELPLAIESGLSNKKYLKGASQNDPIRQYLTVIDRQEAARNQEAMARGISSSDLFNQEQIEAEQRMARRLEERRQRQRQMGII